MADPGSPTGVGSPVQVIVEDHQDDVEIDAHRWAELARSVMCSEGAHGELTLTFVTVEEISELNRDHMGVDGPTDVLSFPLDAVDESGSDEVHVPGMPTLLGDVVVCPSVAATAAPTHAGSVDDELALLVVHGCLHVLGYDHAEMHETRVMRTREVELLVAHHWGGPPPADFRQEQT